MSAQPAAQLRCEYCGRWFWRQKGQRSKGGPAFCTPMHEALYTADDKLRALNTYYGVGVLIGMGELPQDFLRGAEPKTYDARDQTNLGIRHGRELRSASEVAE